MDLPIYRKLYADMHNAASAERQQQYLQHCGKLTNLQRAEVITELFSPQERLELIELLSSKKRWVQVAAVQIYCDALAELQMQMNEDAALKDER